LGARGGGADGVWQWEKEHLLTNTPLYFFATFRVTLTGVVAVAFTLGAFMLGTALYTSRSDASEAAGHIKE
jgi:hypothetical protein